jgi:dTDP-4-dehydrorhamnose 3,5-epimerase
MKFQATELPGVILVEPDVHRDERGFFLETYQKARYQENGIDVEFVQDNHSASVRGTLRGLHAQLTPHPQAKLIRALSGEIFDVAVDARVGSPTFGLHTGARLSSDNHRQLYVPAGFLHGFVVLSELAEVEYKCSALYAPDCEVAVAWNDPAIAIPWPVERPVLSPRDAAAPSLTDVRERLMPYEGGDGR